MNPKKELPWGLWLAIRMLWLFRNYRWILFRSWEGMRA